MSGLKLWATWLVGTILAGAYLTYSLVAQTSSTVRTYLPGMTTHGHYQIELRCSECHTPAMGVLENSCVRCHGADLKASRDTHPKKKFRDPAKAHLLEDIDARNCITCHKEHVPNQTLAMGLTLPSDYCWHCHQEVAEQRLSHVGFAYNSCATAGCHNYHDNQALYENYIAKHTDEPETLDDSTVLERDFKNYYWEKRGVQATPLTADQHDAPSFVKFDSNLLSEWSETAHASAGVNCSDCHVSISENSEEPGNWGNTVPLSNCQECHENEASTFIKGRHGMRLAVGLSPMKPKDARLPMSHQSMHRELKCSACHTAHRFDTAFAAVDACLQCHTDSHSLAYKQSSHFSLWEEEIAGIKGPGTGVSCATCHMPRTPGDDHTFVLHNQNANLRPNEKMIRTVCANCHGLQFSLNALSDPELVRSNYAQPPAVQVDSVEMVREWFSEREQRRP